VSPAIEFVCARQASLSPICTRDGNDIEKPAFNQIAALAIAGGLLVSQWLTLYTTPVIYLYLDRFAHWMSGKRRRPTGEIPAGG